jgi:hypothetical protein
MDFRQIANDNRILEIRVGSHLFGTDTPESDLDLFGVFMPSEEMVFGFQRCEEVDLGTTHKDDTGRNTADAVDRKLHEYRKFVRLALQNNPNILHVLFADPKNIVYQNEFGKRLLDNGEHFIHKGAHHRFVKYADSQRHKMRIKPDNYAKLIAGLEFLEHIDDDRVLGEFKDTPPFTYGGKGKHVRLGDLSLGVGTFVKKAKQKIADRLSKATHRTKLFTKYGFDTKFGSSLIQLLYEGIEIMETGWVQMPLACRQDVLDIKRGKYSVEEILSWSDRLVEAARVAYETSPLPAHPPTDYIEQFMIGEVKSFLGLYE